MVIVWDERKRRNNLEKHGFDFAALDEAFFLRSTVLDASRGRQMAIGPMGEDILAVIFVFLGREGLSVISMRRASRKERARR